MIDVETIFDSEREEYDFMKEKNEKPMKGQIDEIAKLICTYPQCIHHNIIGECANTECQTVYIAENLYKQGYRKQSEGEWIRQEKKNGKVAPEAVCSNCGRDVEYQVIDGKWAFENYCSHCGAHMTGGKE
jgi:hypothetical protein